MESIYGITVRGINTSRSGVDASTRSFLGGHTSHPVFTFFGKEVFAQDLRQEGVVARIMQKRFTADVKVRYLDPNCGFSAVFKAPAHALGYNLKDCLVEHVLQTITTSKYFYALDQYQHSEYQGVGFSRIDLLQQVISMNEIELEHVSVVKSKPVASAEIIQFKKEA
jgi:hypothetical protein